MNAIPLVTMLPIQRPVFDDRHLGNEGLWILANAAALARYWQTLGRALGLDDSEGEEDLQHWLSEQHRQQMREHPGFTLEKAS